MYTPFGELPDRFLSSGMSIDEADEYLRARSSRRSFLRGAALLGGAAVVGPTLWQQPGWSQAAPPGSPRLAFGNDPTTTMNVSWSTPAPVANPRLSYGIASSAGTTVAADTRTVGGLKPVATNYHHVRLTGLAPGTTYRYRVAHDGASVDGLSFTTARRGDHPFTFTAFGDQGITTAAADNTALIAGIDPAFNLVAGDVAYADGIGTGLVVDLVQFDPTRWDDWFAETAVAQRRSPWMPAMGNHDMEPGMGLHGYGGHYARLALPTNGFNEVVYAFRYGNVGVVAADANDISEEIPSAQLYTNGRQTPWIDATLAAFRADPTIDFLVVYFHHCAYCTMTSHGSDGGVRSKWVPLFDRHHVDLVINGHNHGYERTHPVRANAPTAEAPVGATVRSDQLGTTYICAGGGGRAPDDFGSQAFISHGPVAYQLKADAELEPSAWSSVRRPINSFIRADVRPPDADGLATMAITTISSKGTTIDQVTLRRARVRNAAATSTVGGAQPATGAVEAADLNRAASRHPASGHPAASGTGRTSGGTLAATGGHLDRLAPIGGLAGTLAAGGVAGLTALRRRAAALEADSPSDVPR
ncbi:MAG TPA: metallophosphoesterase family protein [Acidimicrobiales bacterium]|nr:metallophosphoesterase family protein [Acidimicrobiales bacterium]